MHLKNGKKLYIERGITFFHETERYVNDLNIYNRSKNGTNLWDDLIFLTKNSHNKETPQWNLFNSVRTKLSPFFLLSRQKERKLVSSIHRSGVIKKERKKKVENKAEIGCVATESDCIFHCICWSRIDLRKNLYGEYVVSAAYYHSSGRGKQGTENVSLVARCKLPCLDRQL